MACSSAASDPRDVLFLDAVSERVEDGAGERSQHGGGIRASQRDVAAHEGKLHVHEGVGTENDDFHAAFQQQGLRAAFAREDGRPGRRGARERDRNKDEAAHALLHSCGDQVSVADVIDGVNGVGFAIGNRRGRGRNDGVDAVTAKRERCRVGEVSENRFRTHGRELSRSLGGTHQSPDAAVAGEEEREDGSTQLTGCADDQDSLHVTTLLNQFAEV